MVEAAARAGFRRRDDGVIAIDVAASSLTDAKGRYCCARAGCERSSDEVIDMLESWVDEFPIVSIEDGLDEEDWSGWKRLTERLGHRCRLIGDDLFATSPERLARGIHEGIANGVLVKINQNGTLTGTLDVIRKARLHGYAPVVSARSGETVDSFIADLALGTAAGQIKIGSVRGGERLAKYNQLLRIEETGEARFVAT